MINEKKKRNRRILWAFLLFFIFSGVGIVSGIIPSNIGGIKESIILKPELEPNPVHKLEAEDDLEQKKIEAEQVISEVFCYCSPEDLSYGEEISNQLNKKGGFVGPPGGMECLGGYYDEIQDIAYISGIYDKGMFHDSCKCFKYYYRDFYLKNGIQRFDFYSLDKPEFYRQPIVFRIYNPKIYNDVSDTNYYEKESGKEGYKFIKYDDVYCSISHGARGSISKAGLMVNQPTNFDYYGKIPFEEYAELIDVDLAKVIFIDIK